MAAIATITLRSAFATQAMATMGVDPEWDRLLSDFMRAEALYFADSKWGALRKAYDANDMELTRLEGSFGKDWKNDPRARRRWDEAYEILQAAEDRSSKQFTYPMWAAARALAKYPAPTLAAALFKVQVIHSEEVWNDSAMDADYMQIVTDDMARLAA